MCGFAGFLAGDFKGDKAAVVTKMGERIIHRGPDQDAIYTDDDIALCFRRLALIDLEGGAQPMFNEDGSLVLVFNGEIYNFRQLREDLIGRGHIFKNKSDSEVLLHGYEEYGPEFTKKLRGMYAFVIWDKKNKRGDSPNGS